MKRLWAIFDAENMLVNDKVFESMFDLMAYCKREWTYKEFIEYEFTANEFVEDETGCIVEFTDQFNPYA